MRKFKKFSCLLQWCHIEALEKIKDKIVRSTLYPLYRNVDWVVVGMIDVKSVRTQGLLTHLSVLLLKQVTKLSLNLTKCLIYLFSCKTWGKHYRGKTTDRFRCGCNNSKMEARKAECGDVENVKHKFL